MKICQVRFTCEPLTETVDIAANLNELHVISKDKINLEGAQLFFGDY